MMTQQENQLDEKKKQPKSVFYKSLLILCIALPIIFIVVGYLMNEKVYYKSTIPFIIVLVWLLIKRDQSKKNKS